MTDRDLAAETEAAKALAKEDVVDLANNLQAMTLGFETRVAHLALALAVAQIHRTNLVDPTKSLEGFNRLTRALMSLLSKTQPPVPPPAKG